MEVSLSILLFQTTIISTMANNPKILIIIIILPLFQVRTLLFNQIFKAILLNVTFVTNKHSVLSWPERTVHLYGLCVYYSVSWQCAYVGFLFVLKTGKIRSIVVLLATMLKLFKRDIFDHYTSKLYKRKVSNIQNYSRINWRVIKTKMQIECTSLKTQFVISLSII